MIIKFYDFMDVPFAFPRSEKGIKSHSVIPSLVQTAKRQSVHPLTFLKTLLTADTATAQAALYNNST
jgi:hypothetical protein